MRLVCLGDRKSGLSRLAPFVLWPNYPGGRWETCSRTRQLSWSYDRPATGHYINRLLDTGCCWAWPFPPIPVYNSEVGPVTDMVLCLTTKQKRKQINLDTVGQRKVVYHVKNFSHTTQPETIYADPPSTSQYRTYWTHGHFAKVRLQEIFRRKFTLKIEHLSWNWQGWKCVVCCVTLEALCPEHAVQFSIVLPGGKLFQQQYLFSTNTIFWPIVNHNHQCLQISCALKLF